ncbi:hypothetical protein Tsubulata_040961, partial [Turnera subulata]
MNGNERRKCAIDNSSYLFCFGWRLNFKSNIYGEIKKNEALHRKEKEKSFRIFFCLLYFSFYVRTIKEHHYSTRIYIKQDLLPKLLISQIQIIRRHASFLKANKYC